MKKVIKTSLGGGRAGAGENAFRHNAEYAAKKIFVMFAAVVTAVNLYAVTSYTITGTSNNLTLTITGSGNMYNYSYTGNATWNSHQAFIKTLIIEDGVTSIGSYAFYYCRSLTSITMPNSVTTIEEGVLLKEGENVQILDLAGRIVGALRAMPAPADNGTATIDVSSLP